MPEKKSPFDIVIDRICKRDFTHVSVSVRYRTITIDSFTCTAPIKLWRVANKQTHAHIYALTHSHSLSHMRRHNRHILLGTTTNFDAFRTFGTYDDERSGRRRRRLIAKSRLASRKRSRRLNSQQNNESRHRRTSTVLVCRVCCVSSSVEFVCAVCWASATALVNYYLPP